MHKNFNSSYWFLNNKIFSLFFHSEVNASYAEICKIGILEADFQQVPLFKFSENFTILL